MFYFIGVIVTLVVGLSILAALWQMLTDKSDCQRALADALKLVKHLEAENKSLREQLPRATVKDVITEKGRLDLSATTEVKVGRTTRPYRKQIERLAARLQ